MPPRFLSAALGLSAIVLVGAASVSPVQAAPTDPSEILTSTQAREDLELAISATEAALPDIYWHQSRQDWAMAKHTAREQIRAVHNSEELWRVLRPLLVRIGEGHLSLQRSDAMNQAYAAAPRFPLDVLWTEDGAFVIAGYGGAAGTTPGARLISVDGVDAATLLDQIVSVTGHDGIIRTGAMRDASGRGFAAVLYRLRGPQTSFEVVLDGPDGRVSRTLQAVTRTDRPSEAGPGSPLPTLEWLDDQTAYLSVPTFSNRQFTAVNATFPDAIHAVFEELRQRGAKDLILDLRENGGGSEPNEAILFSYLADQPLHRYASVEARGFHLSVKDRSGRTYTTDVFAPEDLPQLRRNWRGRITRLNRPPEGLMSHWTPASPVFEGRLVVLAGGDTFSGGAELASMLYHVRRGVFVGEEVAGTHEGNTSGYSWSVELPNSHMTLKLPLLQFRFNWPGLPKGRGVQPDCPAQPRVSELGVHRDRAWRLARNLFRQDWHEPAAAVCPTVDG